MKAAYSFLLFICYNFSSLAQEVTPQDLIKVLGYGVGNSTDQTTLSLQEVQNRSDQCIPEVFTKADITLSNKNTLEEINIKYDFKEHILIIDQNDKIYVAAANMIDTVVFQDHPKFKTFINVNQIGRAYDRRGFYEVLINVGNSFLLKYRSIDRKVLSDNRNMTGLETMGTTVADTTYTHRLEYLIYDKHSLYLLQNFKSKSLEELNKPTELLKAYIKKEKLKFKNEEDLKKFANYYWSL